MNEEHKLALRVFKRSSRYLVLLWRRIPDADPLEAKLTFKDIKGDAPTVILDSTMFTIDESTGQGQGKVASQAGLSNMNVSADTVICLVREKKVDLEPSSAYYVRVSYGDAEESIKLVPAGTFPSHEPEDKKKNVHLMGWFDSKGDWRKISAVRGPRGQFFLATVYVDPKTGKPLDPSTMKPYNDGNEEE